jgi:hypothetical protein
VTKRLGLFDVRKVPESQKHAKTRKLHIVKKMKGGHLENPWIQWKKCPGPYKTIK